MKKLYMLVAAMLMVSFSFAQIQPKAFQQDPHKIAGMPDFKHKTAVNSKSAAAGQWLCYGDAIWTYFAQDPGADDINVARVAIDSNGLTHYTDGETGHGVFFGWGQTFDFNHSTWSDVAEEGSIALNHLNSYSIDSVAIIGCYLRGDSVPAGNVDTLIVAVNTTLSEDNMTHLVAVSNNTPLVQYYNVGYDANTHLTTGATIYKLPLTAADAGETDEEGHISASEFVLPINLNGVTNKVINITYSLKRGYTVPLDSNINDHSVFYGWFFKDPRPNYSLFDSEGNLVVPTEEIYNDVNHGTIISDDNVNHTGQDFFRDYLRPGSTWNQYFHYPYLLAKISCDNCEIVNVPELEKTNPTVYPNPATNNFTVNLGNDEKANIQLFNIVGQQVYSETITGSAQVNVANLNSGVYMLKVSQNGSVYTTKVVVK